MEKKINKAVNTFKSKHPWFTEVFHIVFIIIGGVLAALGLEAFLIPNGFLDGGVTGVAIIASKFIGLPVGALIGILNIPFVVLTWIKLGKKAAFRTVIGVATLACSTILFHHMEPWATEYVVALVFGGGLLGAGIGIALKNGGALDGTEALATIIANRSNFSVHQLILYINMGIFIVAGFIMGWGYAMSSAICFILVVTNIINRIMDGSSGLQLVTVTTAKPELVAESILEITNRHASITERQHWTHAKGFAGTVHKLQFVITRLEAASVDDAINEVDPEAVIMTSPVTSVQGGVYDDIGGEH